MAKKRVGDKAERVLKLLLGLRNKKVASALSARGFGKADLEEGFALLRGLTDVAMGVLPPENVNPTLVLSLDAWENEWFPVADATLSRHYPEVHAKLFLNLSQTEGAAVVISVGTFIDRLEQMNKADGGYGPDGKDARKLLERRGLTRDVAAEAKALLEKVTTIEKRPEPPDLEAQRAEVTAAEDKMWAWYLEWGTIARAAIKDRGLLRQLGFLAPSRGRTSEEEGSTVAAPGATGSDDLMDNA
jgi:hypothetical protein